MTIFFITSQSERYDNNEPTRGTAVLNVYDTSNYSVGSQAKYI